MCHETQNAVFSSLIDQQVHRWVPLNCVLTEAKLSSLDLAVPTVLQWFHWNGWGHWTVVSVNMALMKSTQCVEKNWWIMLKVCVCHCHIDWSNTFTDTKFSPSSIGPQPLKPHSSSSRRKSGGRGSGSGLFVPKQIPQIPEWDLKGEVCFLLFPVSLLRQVKMASCYFNLHSLALSRSGLPSQIWIPAASFR